VGPVASRMHVVAVDIGLTHWMYAFSMPSCVPKNRLTKALSKRLDERRAKAGLSADSAQRRVMVIVNEPLSSTMV
jgi:hypothetical protein